MLTSHANSAHDWKTDDTAEIIKVFISLCCCVIFCCCVYSLRFFLSSCYQLKKITYFTLKIQNNPPLCKVASYYSVNFPSKLKNVHIDGKSQIFPKAFHGYQEIMLRMREEWEKKLFNVGKKKGLKHSRERRNALYSKMWFSLDPL